MNYIENYTSTIEYINKEGTIEKKLDILLKLGQKLLNTVPDQTQKCIKDLILSIIQSYKTGTGYKYEKLIKIYINQEKYLEDILEFIMKKDEECSNIIIHRRIEICLEQINQAYNNHFNNEKIIEILKNKKYQTKYDQNYLLMLFKTNSFFNGVTILAEQMQLRQELLDMYMYSHDFQKILNLCQNFGGVDNNFWIQALNYFVHKLDKSTPNRDVYLNTILDNVIDNEIISPLQILDILKSSQDMNYDMIKSSIIKILEKESQLTKTNTTEFESAEGMRNKFSKELFEMRTKGQQFSIYKCTICKQPTSNLNVVPVVFFLCNHAYHIYCLNTEIKEENNEKEQCPECWNRNHQINQRIIQSEEKANNTNEFRMELETKPKKFDLISKYLGMGLFK